MANMQLVCQLKSDATKNVTAGGLLLMFWSLLLVIHRHKNIPE